MDCAAKGQGTPCAPGLPGRRCGLCGAVAYCSKAHQMSHWEDHREECGRLAEQMKRAEALGYFPFTFSAKVPGTGKQEIRCSILESIDLHHIGVWRSECSCRPSVASLKNSWKNDSWDLPSLLCPCSEPKNPLSTCIGSWKDYYQWRSLPFNSPVALLLHWPLTVYYSFQVSGLQLSAFEDTSRLHIHYLGPEKELLQLGVFGELKALFPGVQLHMEFVGPAVPKFRDGELISLSNYVHCSGEGCCCKVLSADSCSGLPNRRTSTVTIKLRKGFYHDRYGDIIQDSSPHLVIAPNAGVAAYSSWLPTIELLKKMGVPAIFTDYCEEAAGLAANCIATVTGKTLRIPVQLNPFRQPVVVEDSAFVPPMLLQLLSIWDVISSERLRKTKFVCGELRFSPHNL